MAKKKVKSTRYIGTIFVFGSILLVGAIYLLNRSQVQDIRSNAEDDPNFCANQCDGRDRCSFNSKASIPNDPNYNDPCCEELQKTGSAYACPWPQRGYCTDDQCAAIPEGQPRERCGGPRHSWCNKCIDAGCAGYSKNSVPSTVAPTSMITKPTAVPVIDDKPSVAGPLPTLPIPTTIPNPTNPIYPTQGAQPIKPRQQITYVPIVYPTNPPPMIPTAVPTKMPYNFSLPNLLPAKEKVDVFIQNTKFSILDFLSKILP